MHSFETSTTQFLFNGDFSGDVEIDHVNGDAVTIPFEDLMNFMAYYLRTKRISALENATDNEILEG